MITYTIHPEFKKKVKGEKNKHKKMSDTEVKQTAERLHTETIRELPAITDSR
jgi:hypothetical protein